MEKRFNLFLILVYIAVVAVCYSSVLNGEFLWDDDHLIKNNPLVRAPLLSLAPFKQDIVNSGFNTTIYYRPIQILSYAIDYRLWGGFDPFGYHFTSLLLHLLNGFLVFLLSKRLLADRTVSFLTGLIFLIHPASSGCVSYISSRADLLFFFFGFSSLLLFYEFRARGKREFLTASIISFAFSMLCREGAVIFPALILLMDLSFFKRSIKIRALACLPYFLMAGGYIFLHHILFSDRYSSIFVVRSFADSVLAFAFMLIKYVVLALLPVGMYVRPAAGAPDPLSIAVFSTTVLAFAGAYAYLKDRRKEILFGILFFLLGMTPMFFVAGYFNVYAAHWLYLPGYGLIFTFSVIFVYIYRKTSFFLRAALVLLLFFIVVFFALSVNKQTSFWQDDVSLSDHVLASSEKDVNALHFKAVSLISDGKETEALDIIDDYALSNASQPRAWYIKGRMYLAAKKPDVAEISFKKSLEVSPVYDNGYLGLGLVAAYREEAQKAITFLERAVALNKYNYEALTFLGILYSEIGDNRMALDSAMRLKRVNPYSLNAIINMGTAYSRVGQLGFAAEEYLRAVTLYPEEPKAYYNLAYTFYAAGEIQEAEKWTRRCLQVDPAFKPALELALKLKKL